MTRAVPTLAREVVPLQMFRESHAPDHPEPRPSALRLPRLHCLKRPHPEARSVPVRVQTPRAAQPHDPPGRSARFCGSRSEARFPRPRRRGPIFGTHTRAAWARSRNPLPRRGLEARAHDQTQHEDGEEKDKCFHVIPLPSEACRNRSRQRFSTYVCRGPGGARYFTDAATMRNRWSGRESRK